jgi:hypothetical protein
MATPFNKVYDKFLASVDDYELGLMTDEDLYELLYTWLDRAISLEFTTCYKDLNDITEPNYPDELGKFNIDLDRSEINILALCMKKFWLEVKSSNADLMRRSIGDRDYRTVQGYQYLRELKELKLEIDRQINEYQVAYTYKNFKGFDD